MGLLHNGMVVGGNNGEVLYSGNNHTGNWSQDRLAEFNAYNMLTDTPDQTINTSGITGQVEDGVFTLSGTATAPFNFNLYNNANELPDYFKPGANINLIYERTGSNSAPLHLRILSYDTNGNTTLFGDWNRSATIHVPDSFDGVGLIIRLYVRTGATVDGSVHPIILNAMTNKQLTEAVNQNNEFSNPPMLTIIDDDGNVGFYTDLLPLVESRGISISSAVISDRANRNVETHMTWAQIEDASKRGAEIVNHTFDHLTGDRVVNMTEQEVWLNYQRARNTLASHGITGAGYLVYAGASGSYAQAQSAAKHSNKCAFRAGGNTINYRGSFDPYYINRYRVQTDGYDYDPDQLKALVDKCLEEGGWMVWMIHTSETVWTTLNGLAGITAAVDYAIEKGLPVVSVDTGYRMYIA